MDQHILIDSYGDDKVNLEHIELIEMMKNEPISEDYEESYYSDSYWSIGNGYSLLYTFKS